MADYSQTNQFKQAYSGSPIDHDFTDRLHFHFTVLYLVVSAAIIAVKTLGAGFVPIQCFIPANFPPPWEQYAEDYCFIQGTYFVKLDEDYPKEPERLSRVIRYYQWLPFFLGLQAIMFFIPHLIWTQFNKSSGIHLETLVNYARVISHVPTSKAKKDSIKEKDEKVLLKKFLEMITPDMYKGKELSKLIAKRVGEKQEEKPHNEDGSQNHNLGVKRQGDSIADWRFSGSRLVILYIITKVLTLLNVIFQLFFINFLLGASLSEFPLFGLSHLIASINGKDWSHHGHFPRIAFCDVPIREMGGIHKYSIQCVLPINMLAEKIYLALWFWCLFLAVLSGINLIIWIWKLAFSSAREHFIKNFLMMSNIIKEPGDKDCDPDNSELELFVHDFLKMDRVFALRLIASNASYVFAAQIIGILYRDLYLHYYKKDNSGTDSIDGKGTFPANGILLRLPKQQPARGTMDENANPLGTDDIDFADGVYTPDGDNAARSPKRPASGRPVKPLPPLPEETTPAGKEGPRLKMLGQPENIEMREFSE